MRRLLFALAAQGVSACVALAADPPVIDPIWRSATAEVNLPTVPSPVGTLTVVDPTPAGGATPWRNAKGPAELPPLPLVARSAPSVAVRPVQAVAAPPVQPVAARSPQPVAVPHVQAPAHPAVAPLVIGFPCPPTPCGPNSGVPGVGAPSLFPDSPATPGFQPGGPAVNPPDLGGGGFARQSEGGTQVARSFAPNMFGDVLGARSIRFGYQVPFFCRFGIEPNSAITTATGGAAVTINPNVPGTRFEFGGPTAPRGPTTPVVVPGPFSNTDLRFAQPVGNVPSDTAFTTAAVQALMSAGQLTPSQVAAFSQLTPAQQAQLLRNRGAINNTVTQGTRGLAVRTITLSDLTVTVTPDGQFADCVGILDGTQNVALPGGSTFIGRVKMSEDTSPLPRDRVLFAYDHFNAVPLTPDGFAVNRFQFGFEKTFLDGRWSAEARLPFAGTIAATNVQGFEVGNVELGNLRFALKRILTQNGVLTTTAGIAVTVPTAADQVILSSLDGSEFYRYRNQQVTLEPFVAALVTPNARLFSQTWASVNFDVTGGELTYNTAIFGGSGSERLYDVPYLSVDQQIGYWLVRRDAGRLRGLAPFVELHWNYAITQEALVRRFNDRLPANGLTIGGVATHELNLIAGLLFQVGDNLNVSVGAAAPLLQKPERTFDAQVGIRVNYLFGRTAQARNPVNAIGTY